MGCKDSFADVSTLMADQWILWLPITLRLHPHQGKRMTKHRPVYSQKTHLCCIYPALGKVVVIFKLAIVFRAVCHQQDFLHVVDSLIVGNKVWNFYVLPFTSYSLFFFRKEKAEVMVWRMMIQRIGKIVGGLGTTMESCTWNVVVYREIDDKA